MKSPQKNSQRIHRLRVGVRLELMRWVIGRQGVSESVRIVYHKSNLPSSAFCRLIDKFNEDFHSTHKCVKNRYRIT